MDIASVVGIILALIAIGVGMMFKGVSPAVLVNPAALLIIILGTIAAVTIATPLNDLKKVPKLIGIVFKEQNQISLKDLIPLFTNLSQIARKDGLLALEEKLTTINDSFLQNGLQLTVDGMDAEVIRDIMSEEIEAMEERHQIGASIFTQAGTYAPTLGVLGAVIGLIAALGYMEDIEKLGHAISAAFVATLLGIFTGYVLWIPFANKLKAKSKQEVKVKLVMIEGVISVLGGMSPNVIQRKLLTYLPPSEREALNTMEVKGKTNE